MRKRRIVTDELINRVHRAEEEIYNWMTSNNIVETTPELRMEVLELGKGLMGV